MIKGDKGSFEVDDFDDIARAESGLSHQESEKSTNIDDEVPVAVSITVEELEPEPEVYDLVEANRR